MTSVDRTAWVRVIRALPPEQRQVIRAQLNAAFQLAPAQSSYHMLRIADRLWRTCAPARITVAPLLAQLLITDGREPAAVLGVLLKSVELLPCIDREIAYVEGLLHFGWGQAALQRLTERLPLYSVDDPKRVFRLWHRAQEAARAAMPLSGGLALIDGTLRIHARCAVSSGASTRFELVTESGRVLAHRRGRRVGQIASLSMPMSNPDDLRGMVWLLYDGSPVPGACWRLPFDFRVQGHCAFDGRHVRGTVQMAWAPTRALAVVVEDLQGHSHTVRTGTDGRFALNLDGCGLIDSVSVRVRLPDGRLESLPGSPLLTRRRLQQHLRQIGLPSAAQRTGSVVESGAAAIIIPVYDGYQQTLACIESVLSTVDTRLHPVIVIDDASPNAELSAALDRFAAGGAIRLLRNPSNLGFPDSVNRAMQQAGARDAVIVNADVVVFGDWLQRLLRCAQTAADVATVTPFADDDSIVGYRAVSGDTAAVDIAAQLDRHARDAHRQQSLELPVGVGFCLYLRRAAWDAVGPLDGRSFGKGYGEESDWCMRARRLGWRHLLAADVVVHHAGGVSFGPRRAALIARAQHLLEMRHRGYSRYVAEHSCTAAIDAWRRGFDRLRLESCARPVALIVLHALGGGVDRFVRGRIDKLREQGLLPLLLQPLSESPGRYRLWSPDLSLRYLQYRDAQQAELLSADLAGVNLAHCEIHHFVGVDARLIDVVRRLACGYHVYLHDYSWICPRVTLMDGSGRYCGEPVLAQCRRCVATQGSDLGETIDVAALRRRSDRWLAGAHTISAPSRDAQQRFLRYFPQRAIGVDMPESEPEPVTAAPRRRLASGTIKVALIGAIGEHKGYQVLRRVAARALADELPLEFVVVGRTDDDGRLMRAGRVFVTGTYQEAEVPALLRREQPDMIWLPSVWPETWCYALTHALQSGLPILSYDIGAVAERLRQAGRGVLLPIQATTSDWLSALLSITTGAAEAPTALRLPPARRTQRTALPSSGITT